MHRAGPSPGIGEDDLHALVDGRLAAGRHREVVAHLAVHPDASGRVAALFEHRVGLAALREALVDGEAEPRLAGMEEALCRVVREQRRALRAGGLHVLHVAAASGWWITGRETMTTPPVASAGEGRIAPTRAMLAGARTVEASASDPATLWFQEHLVGRSLKQPNLEPLGLRFAGSSVLRSEGGPAIRFVYTDDSGRGYDLVVGAWPGRVELVPSPAPERYVSLTWRHDPLIVSLAAPREGAQLDEIIRSVGRLLDPSPVATDAEPGAGDEPGPISKDSDVPAGPTLEGVAPQPGQVRSL